MNKSKTNFLKVATFVVAIVLTLTAFSFIFQNEAKAAGCVTTPLNPVKWGGTTFPTTAQGIKDSLATPESAEGGMGLRVNMGPDGIPGWLILDFGCFPDVVGPDFAIYELGVI